MHCHHGTGLKMGRRCVKHTSRQGGFTLAEVLVALALLSIAGYISVSLFTASRNLAHANRYREVGVRLAHEQLARLTQQAAEFNWPDPASLKPGEFSPITRKDKMPPGFLTPSAAPATPQASLSVQNLYERFTWEAFASVPSAEAPYVDVTVVVHWKLQLRQQSTTFTSAMDRKALEAAL